MTHDSHSFLASHAGSSRWRWKWLIGICELNFVGTPGCSAKAPPPPRPEIVTIEVAWDRAEPVIDGRERLYGYDVTLRTRPGLSVQGKGVDQSGIVKVRYDNATTSAGRLVLQSTITDPSSSTQATYDLASTDFKPYVEAIPGSNGHSDFYCIGKDCWGQANVAELTIRGRDCDKAQVEVDGKRAARIERDGAHTCGIQYSFNPNLDPKLLVGLNLARATSLDWQQVYVPVRLIFDDVTLEFTVKAGDWYSKELTALFNQLAAGQIAKPAWMVRGSNAVVVKLTHQRTEPSSPPRLEGLYGTEATVTQVTHVARVTEEETVQPLSCGAYKEWKSGNLSKPEFTTRGTSVTISNLSGRQVARQVLRRSCPDSINGQGRNGVTLTVDKRQVDEWLIAWTRSQNTGQR
jgi:hypothetical protein